MNRQTHPVDPLLTFFSAADDSPVLFDLLISMFLDLAEACSGLAVAEGVADLPKALLIIS